MSEYYYYFRDKENKPRITVCLKKWQSNGDSMFTRGVAVCSHLDNPNKKTGKNIASGRADRAMIKNESGDPIHREDAINVVCDTNRLFDLMGWKKSEVNPELTDFERRVVGVT